VLGKPRTIDCLRYREVLLAEVTLITEEKTSTLLIGILTDSNKANGPEFALSARNKDVAVYWRSMADRCSDFCPVPELRKACDNRPEVPQGELRRSLQTSEFRTLAFRLDQGALLREELHKFMRQILSSLFSTPQMTIHQAQGDDSPLRKKSLHTLTNRASSPIPRPL
jgi:hypothetical protein